MVSCANWEAGHFAAYRHLAARGDLDAWLHLGDYIYEYGTGEYGTRDTVVRPHAPAHEILSLADYRVRHGRYKTDPDLPALHAAAPNGDGDDTFPFCAVGFECIATGNGYTCQVAVN